MARARYETVSTNADLIRGAEALARQCKVMADLYRTHGLPPMRKMPADFAGLSQIVVGQQLSAQSARAIWQRVWTAHQPFDASAISASDEAALAALGLSRGKIRTLKALALAVEKKELDVVALKRASEDDIIALLTALHGIGPWTADIYLLFALRRADAFAPGDLALQLAAQRLYALGERPSAQALAEIAERWRPYRAIAARLLWVDYAATRRLGSKPADQTQVETKRRKSPI